MANNFRITIPPQQVYAEWTDLDEVVSHYNGNEDVVLEIVKRYMDGENHRKNYRVKRNDTIKKALAMFKASQDEGEDDAEE